MRIISIIIASISLIAGILCVLIVSKFSEMFEDTTQAIPGISGLILESFGWIPGGIFFVATGLLTTLILAKKNKIAGLFAISTAIAIIITAASLPILLLAPISTMIQSLEESKNIEEAEQGSTGQPATRPLFESEGSDKPQPEAEGRSR